MDGWLQGPSDHSGLRKERGLAGRSLEGLRLGFGVVESPRGEDTIQEWGDRKGAQSPSLYHRDTETREVKPNCHPAGGRA